jgi:hypothetical protein
MPLFFRAGMLLSVSHSWLRSQIHDLAAKNVDIETGRTCKYWSTAAENAFCRGRPVSPTDN